MLRTIVATVLLLILLPAVAGATTGYQRHHVIYAKQKVYYKHHVYYRYLKRHWSRHVRHRQVTVQQRVSAAQRDNPAVDCWGRARAEGGPCGCLAQHNFFGSTTRLWRGWNLWLADVWRRAFPAAEAAPNTAAVWPGRHVAKVLQVDAKRIFVHDSYGHRWVSRSGVVFVQPPVLRRANLVAYAGGAPL